MIIEENLFIGKVDGIVRVVKQIDNNTFRIMGSLVNYDSNEIEIIKPLFISEQQKHTELNKQPDSKASYVSGSWANCPNCGQELQLGVKEMTNSELMQALQANNR